MINLLPSQNKQSIRREYLARLGAVATAAFSFAVVIGIISLFPSFFQSVIKERELEQQKVIAEKASLLREESSIETTASAINKKIAVFMPENEKEELPPSMLIQSIALTRGETQLLGFFYQKNTDKKGTDKIIITGTAARREELLAFSERLRGIPAFSEVNVPTSNLTQSKDINFSITAFRNK